MPYYPDAGSVNILGSGTAQSLYFTGSAISSVVVDATGTAVITAEGGAAGVNVDRTGTLIGSAVTIDFSGTGVTAINFANGTASISTSAGAGGATPGGSNGQIQYRVDSTTFGGALSATIDASGNLNIRDQSGSNSPPQPTSGITLFTRNRIGRNNVGVLPASGGYDYTLQPHMSRQKVGLWNPPGNATTVPGVFGFTAVATSGTATANNVAATPFSATMRRLAYVGAAAAGNGGSVCCGAAQWFRGSEAGSGGFHMVARCVLDLNTVTTTQASFFCGMSASIVDTGAVLNGNGTITGTFINGVGVMKATGQTNYYFIWNGAGGIASSSDTGIAMANGDALEVAVYSPPNGTYCGMSIEVLQSGTVAQLVTGAANLPVNTALMAPHVRLGNGATAAAVRLAVQSIYIETDN